ncbi:MAG: DCC1-like thiol-disulfide oxidoreductase family protein [Alphaproteobacteria bacterium]
MPSKTEIQIIYDRECPFCRNYINLIRVQKNYTVTLIDARTPSAITDDIKNKHHLNFDEGMVVKINENVYFGADAMHMISLLSTKSGFLNRIISFIFKSKHASCIIYPILKWFRKLTLWLLRIPLINEQKH